MDLVTSQIGIEIMKKISGTGSIEPWKVLRRMRRRLGEEGGETRNKKIDVKGEEEEERLQCTVNTWLGTNDLRYHILKSPPYLTLPYLALPFLIFALNSLCFTP